jgi:hypothetical protein
METISAMLAYAGEVRGTLLVIGCLALYFAFLWAVTRLMLRSNEQLQCPVDGRLGSVAFLRGPDGFKSDVVRCSLQGHEVTCAKQCLRAA